MFFYIQLYFRSLPSPLLTYPLYPQFLVAAQLPYKYQLPTLTRLVYQLPTPHLDTLQYLVSHLHLVSQYQALTGMTCMNLAIVWAPNILRPNSQDCLRDCRLQATVVEALVVHCEHIFQKHSDNDWEDIFEKEKAGAYLFVNQNTFNQQNIH